ncbi:MAG TPA: DUF4038 domain-containing protein [Candidatus Sulfotelmatobacter sp.]|jgi:hypothetical protein|nr:DUF4038 domain-containing protein [Candidatus Sulfotelmatobacter sp.]
MRTPAVLLCCLTTTLCLSVQTTPKVVFTQSALTVAAYHFVEITAKVDAPGIANPFTDASFTGTFSPTGATKSLDVEGFCDSADGSLFRIRFMPSAPGSYNYHLTLKLGSHTETYSGNFDATDSHLRGPIRVDPEHRWHFIWEGTGEHYYFFGDTAYWLMGWRDERIIQNNLERLHRLKINRMRVLIHGRANSYYSEPIVPGSNFTMFISPWLAEKPEDLYRPGYDFTRFDVAYWQRFDRMLEAARDRDIVISLIFGLGDDPVHTQAYSEDERRYFRYAVDRFAAFSNVTWDLGDDLDSFRDEKWTHETGTLLKQWDPYKHLATSHPVHDIHQDRASDWFDFTSIQDWNRTQHPYMLHQRELQKNTGRIIPQTNEEYGYEDHYPSWTPRPPGDSTEVLRRSAWDIAMAGAYQTAGETAKTGTNVWPDTGGGWVNGRGDDSMTLLVAYRRLYDFFTSFSWWLTDPHDELVNAGNYCLAAPGNMYAIYLPNGGSVTVKLDAGKYRAEWYSPLSGERISLPYAEGANWTSPAAPDNHDWALLLQQN